MSNNRTYREYTTLYVCHPNCINLILSISNNGGSVYLLASVRSNWTYYRKKIQHLSSHFSIKWTNKKHWYWASNSGKESSTTKHNAMLLHALSIKWMQNTYAYQMKYSINTINFFFHKTFILTALLWYQIFKFVIFCHFISVLYVLPVWLLETLIGINVYSFNNIILEYFHFLWIDKSSWHAYFARFCSTIG